MAENHPGPALSVFVQGSVQTVPSIWCNRFLTYRFKRALWGIRHETLTSSIGSPGPEGGQQIIFSSPKMYLGSPIIGISPKVAFTESDFRFGPMYQIPALQNIKTGFPRFYLRKPGSIYKLHIGIVLFAHRIRQDKGIADMYVPDMIRIPFFHFFFHKPYSTSLFIYFYLINAATNYPIVYFVLFY